MINRNSNRKLTLEQRIIRLENALHGKRGTRKFEGNDDLAREIDRCLRDEMNDTEWNISVIDAFPKAGCKVEIDDGEDDEWSVKGYFTVRPRGRGLEVYNDDGDFSEGQARDAKDAAKMMADIVYGYVEDM